MIVHMYIPNLLHIAICTIIKQWEKMRESCKESMQQAT